jgi:hypothetical protein
MIKFSLVCQDGHEFEGWFKSGAAYEKQAARAEIVCPTCGSTSVDKAIMAPAVNTRASEKANAAPVPPAPAAPLSNAQFPPAELQQMMRRIREEVHAKAEYVGGRFAEEARRIHFDESPARGIYGEASAEEAKELAEDGIPFFPLPPLPEDRN